jgi:hypothetical protein
MFMEVEYVMYQFFKPTEEEKKQNVIVKLTADFTGVKLDDKNKVVRVSNIKIVSRKPNPVTIKDYLDVDVVFEEPELPGIDEQQKPMITVAARDWLYHWTYLQDPGVRATIQYPISPERDWKLPF